MNRKVRILNDIEEPYAAGLFEEEENSLFERHARAQRRYWENCALDHYQGGWLYPCGKKLIDSFAVYPDFSYTYHVDVDCLKEKSGEAAEWIKDLPSPSSIPIEHTVGGCGYTHSIPHYERILREGLNAYELRISAMNRPDLKKGLLDLISGIHAYHARVLTELRKAQGRKVLIEALEHVPFEPARNLYEAIVCWNFVYYLDFCDNPGRLDAGLFPFYRGEDVTEILREFFHNIDVNNGWTGALGPEYNDLTLQCLRAIRGCRRPSLELRCKKDMPDEIWSEAVKSVFSGCGQPSFYNEAAYQQALMRCYPTMPEADRLRFCGGGCTETMIAGLSNIGSLDAGINLALIFSDYLRNDGIRASSFDSFYCGFLEYAHDKIRYVLEAVNCHRKSRAQCRPHPVRTLLIDDCIDKELDYNEGGARYSGSVINIAGIVNVIDSLLAVRTLVFERSMYSLDTLIQRMDAQDSVLYAQLATCPHYGNNNCDADRLAKDFTTKVLSAFDEINAWPGGPFMASSIQFVTYAEAGKAIPATPDGRKNGDPLCDSIGPLLFRTSDGPTAVLTSASALCQEKMPGTPVLNLRIRKSYGGQALRSLIEGYFLLGGMQIQLTCLSREDMLSALVHPERYGDLIVRIGGYSEYFNRLSPELKQAVIVRTEH